MMKYRKTALVDAEIYMPGMEDGIAEFDSEIGCELPPEMLGIFGHYVLPKPDGTNWICKVPYLITRENQRFYILPGDYIVTNPDGKRHACKPDTFEATHEPVDQIDIS